jgi:hypothetical protein
MNMISVVIIGFIVLEATNVVALYFFPGSKYANSVGVFRAWEQSKQEPEIHDFVKYLVNWVAGTKLIFLLLLIVILFTADVQGLFYTGAALVISISSFFWRLFPLIRKMDRDGQIDSRLDDLGAYDGLSGCSSRIRGWISRDGSKRCRVGSVALLFSNGQGDPLWRFFGSLFWRSFFYFLADSGRIL